MKQIVFMLILGAQAFAFAATNVERLNKNGVALCEDRDSSTDANCYDPVSYIKEQKPVKAGATNSSKFRFNHEGSTYVFSSEENLNLFKANPKQYAPEFGGWCAYAVAEKTEKVDIDPKSFHIQDGKLLLFYNGFLADTKKTWLTDKKKSPDAYLQTAYKNWPEAQRKKP